MIEIKHTYGFPQMARIIPASPEPDKDGFFVRHLTMDEERVNYESVMSSIRRDWTNAGLEAGTYCVLHEKRARYVKQWMSDTWLERSTNSSILQDARGDVLVLGLGIGMVVTAMCAKDEVSSVVVAEISEQVIRLVEPHIRHPKLTVIQADAFAAPLRGRAFDTIYIDIWQGICSDNWEPMKGLLREYRRLARQGAVVTAWLKDFTQTEARTDRQRSWW